MVGWISKSGHAKIKQYYLKGRKSYEVLPGQGDLNMTDIPPVVVLNGANLYLGFQLQFNAPVVQQPTLLAYGSRLPLNHKLTVHDDKTTVYIDYSTGEFFPRSTMLWKTFTSKVQMLQFLDF